MKYLGKNFDRDLVGLARDKVSGSSVVWDISANCGVFAFSAAVARQIVAVETDPFLIDLLQRSRALNDVPVQIVPATVYSSAGLASFSIAACDRASNHLTHAGHDTAGGERGRITIPTFPLDALLDHFAPPTLVKIDVEGAEVAALEGAARLLAEVRPILYLKATRETIDRYTQVLTAANYRLRKGIDLNYLTEPA